ncbi:MAG: hypothetical protein D6731_25265 [Planctomycetota bacterium]|nr:MAG: hypothetical protein D6731_25265 [Planctomycetota bacterium]
MKRSGKCPKCGSRELFHTPEVMDRGEGNVALPFAVGRTGPVHAHDYGQFELFACRRCGYAEFYVIDPGALDGGAGS